MSCCCENPVNVGCIDNCNPVTDLIVKQTGEHTVDFEFLGMPFYFTMNATLDEVFTFPSAILNEDAYITFSITQPDGSAYTLTAADLDDIGHTTNQDGPFTCFTVNVRHKRLLSGTSLITPSECNIVKLVPVEQRFDPVNSDTVTVTNFALADAVRLDVFLDGELVSEVAGDVDTVGFAISSQDIIFSEELIGAEVVLKAFIEEPYAY
jgi:hypothetical protein